MFVEKWFSVPIAYHDLEINFLEKTKDDIFKYIHYNELNLKDEYVKTSWGTDNNIFENANLLELRNIIVDLSIEYLDTLGYSINRNITIQSWLNIFEENMNETIHKHHGSLLSGCYYVSCKEDSGDIEFHDPSEEKKIWFKNNSFDKLKETEHNHEVIKYKPKEGRILLFPPWLAHGVVRNKTKNNRISLAFNLV